MKTVAQTLAERIRWQTKVGEALLELAGAGTEQDRSDTVLGPPEKVLTVRGNVSDIALMNHFFYLSAHESGVLPGEAARPLQAALPLGFPEFRAFLAPREAHTAAEALERLRVVNEQIADEVQVLSDDQLNAELVIAPFSMKLTLLELLLRILTHGALHIGQAWGMLKGAGITEDGFELLRTVR